MSVHLAGGEGKQKEEKETGTKIIFRNIRFFRGVGGWGKGKLHLISCNCLPTCS